MKDEFYYKKDRMGQLRGFCAMVQNNCSVTKAAEKLGLERPAVSRQIIALERDLDVPLFDRNNRKQLNLTEAGQDFYNMVMPALQQIDGMFQNFKKDQENKKKNIIRIATFNIILKKMLPFIINFKNKNPNTEFILMNIEKEEAFKKLINNELDIIIFPMDELEKYPAELEKEKISINISYLTLYLGHPLEKKDAKNITKEDVARYELLSSGFLYSETYRNFIKEYSVVMNTNLSHVNIDLLKELVKNKLGISFIDDFWFDENEKNDFILKKDYIFPPMYFYSFYRRNTKPKKIVKDFSNIIKKNHKKIFH